MIVGCPSSVMRRQHLLQRTSPKLLAAFLTNLGRNDPYMTIFMVPVHCISRSHRLKIDFQDEFYISLNREKHEKILSETIRPRAMIFCMWHHLLDYAPEAKNPPPLI